MKIEMKNGKNLVNGNWNNLKDFKKKLTPKSYNNSQRVEKDLKQ